MVDRPDVPTGNPPRRSQSTGDTIRELLDGGELARMEARLVHELEDAPNDTRLVQRLAEVCRQRGKLREAGELYALAAKRRPGDPILARLASLLRGEGSPRLPPIPTPFALFDGFLPEDELERLRALVRERRDAFDATPVKRDGVTDAMDTETRRSSSFSDLGAVGEAFAARVARLLPGLQERLDVPPFPAAIRSCKVSVYHAGHFFRLHQDRTDGPAASRRLGFIYYFDFPPRRFRGGELVLYDVDLATELPTTSFTTLAAEANRLAFIPAGAWHEVLPIVCDSDDWFAGRFTLSGWIHDEDHPAEG